MAGGTTAASNRADWRYADLRLANLGGAYLEGAMLPAPSREPEGPGSDPLDAARQRAEQRVSQKPRGKDGPDIG